MPATIFRASLVTAALLALPAAWAQTVQAQSLPTQVAGNQVPGDPAKNAATGEAADHLTLYFDPGSTAVRAQDRALLDKAARLYRDAHPVIMIVSGGADSVGSPLINLTVSDARARSVFRELVARGIPADRFQLLAKGITDQQVRAADGAAEQGNRVVEIRWR